MKKKNRSRSRRVEGNINEDSIKFAARKTTAAFDDLPMEILFSIFQKLSLKDYICCGSVCAKWCSVVRECKGLYSKTNPHMPWLMLDDQKKNKNKGRRSFFDLKTSETYSISMAELQGRKLIGWSESWLIAAYQTTSNIYAFNPFTRERIDFAPVSTLPGVVRTVLVPREAHGCHSSQKMSMRMAHHYEFLFYDGTSRLFPPKEFSSYFYHAILSTTCAQRDGLPTVTAVVLSYEKRMAFTRKGDTTWTKIKFPSSIYTFGCESLMFHRGLLFLLDIKGRVWSCKLMTDNENIGGESSNHKTNDHAIQRRARVLPLLVVVSNHQLIPISFNFYRATNPRMRYLVGLPQDSGSGLYQVCLPEESCARVFRLDSVNAVGDRSSVGSHYWVEVESLPNDYAFLLNYIATAVYAPTNSSKFIKENCLYSLAENYLSHEGFQTTIYNGKGYPSKKKEKIYYGKGIRSTDIWITPSVL